MTQSSQKIKDSAIKHIEETWNLESLDAFLDHPVSFIDPAIKSSYNSVVLKPDVYSQHLLRKLWFICRTVKVSALFVRRLLALALIERLEDPNKGGRVKTLSIVVSDVDRVKEKLGLDKENDRASPSPLDSSEDPIAEEKIEDTIVAKGPVTNMAQTDSRSDPVHRPNGTSTSHSNTPVTSARFEVRVPESSSRVQAGTPTPQRQARPPPAPTPVPLPQQTRSPAMTPSSRQQPEHSAAAAAAAATPRSAGKPHQPASVRLSVENPNANYQRDVPPAVKTPSSRPVATPRPAESPKVPQPKPTPSARPKTDSASQRQPDTPLVVETPRAAETTGTRRPAPNSTPRTERPWKRARTSTFNETHRYEMQIRDAECELEVVTAQVNLYARKVKAYREMEDEELGSIDRIQDYLAKEPAINNRISDYVKVLTKLVGLHGEFRTALSLAPDPEGLEPPTMPEQNNIDPPPTALSNLIKSLTHYHDGFAQDLEAARTDLNNTRSSLSDLRKETKEHERDLLNANSERDSLRMRIGRLKEQLKGMQPQQ